MNPFLALANFYKSSIGKKCIVALTGLALVGFVLGHLGGNLTIYFGPEAINAYGEKLQKLGPFLWVIRLGLLGIVALHIIATIHLTIQNRQSRSVGYEKPANLQATWMGRTMIWTGLMLLGFIVYHVLHFTVSPSETSGHYYELLGDGHKRHDIYYMVVSSFRIWWVSAIYLFSMVLLCFHLSHGISSIFQTLGLRTNQTWPWIRLAGYIVAGLVFVGNCSIPLAALLGFLPLPN